VQSIEHDRVGVGGEQLIQPSCTVSVWDKANKRPAGHIKACPLGGSSDAQSREEVHCFAGIELLAAL
jgi:hypothetical protein